MTENIKQYIEDRKPGSWNKFWGLLFSSKIKEQVELSGFDKQINDLRRIYEIIKLLRDTETSPEQEQNFSQELNQIKSNSNLELLKIFAETAQNLIKQKHNPSQVLQNLGYSKSVLPVNYLQKIDTARLSPNHREFLNEEEADRYISLADDVIGVYNSQGKVAKILLLDVTQKAQAKWKEGMNIEEMEKIIFDDKPSYKVIKRIPLNEILNESKFVLKKGKSREKMLEVFKLIHEIPDLYHTFRKKVVSPQSLVQLPFKTVFSLFSLLLQLDKKHFYEVKRFYRRLRTQKQQEYFLEAISILNNNPEQIDLFMLALENENFLEQGENKLLEKIRGILNLIDERNNLIKKVMTEKGQKNVNPWEYNEAILRRLEQLLLQAGRVNNKKEADELLNESDVFNEKLITEGGFFRGNFDQLKNMKPEEIGDLLKNFSAEKVQGGNLIKDPFDMENPANYLYPEKFSIEDYQMIVRNLKETYMGKFPNYLKVLTLNIAKDLQDEDVNFYKLEHKEALIGIRKIKKLSEKEYYSGTFYVDKKLQGSNMGQVMDNWVVNDVPSGTLFVASMAPIPATIKRHVASGRKIVDKEYYETAKREDGIIVKSEKLYKTHRQL